jgi:hypothetical protein
MKLQDIGLKYNTDKATYHKYLDFYEKHINKDKVNRFLEIGIQAGYSIKTWREWFNKDTIVEGWDIEQFDIINGCDLRIVDQTNREQMLKNVTGLYDVILDDGGHTTEMIEKSFSLLFKHTKMYIIEDLHAPWCGKEFITNNDRPSIELIDKIETYGWISKYATEEEKAYISNNAVVVDVYWRGDRSKPESMTAIVANKEYL